MAVPRCSLESFTHLVQQEPTSGLDAALAFKVMTTLQSFTVEKNRTLVTTIHQPSSKIFHMFQTVLLLAGGQVGGGPDTFSGISLLLLKTLGVWPLLAESKDPKPGRTFHVPNSRFWVSLSWVIHLPRSNRSQICVTRCILFILWSKVCPSMLLFFSGLKLRPLGVFSKVKVLVR